MLQLLSTMMVRVVREASLLIFESQAKAERTALALQNRALSSGLAFILSFNHQ